jgi:hypothetical protein
MVMKCHVYICSMTFTYDLSIHPSTKQTDDSRYELCIRVSINAICVCDRAISQPYAHTLLHYTWRKNSRCVMSWISSSATSSGKNFTLNLNCSGVSLRTSWARTFLLSFNQVVSPFVSTYWSPKYHTSLRPIVFTTCIKETT